MSTLLLVDDNETLVRFTARNLESAIAGLRVSIASSGGQARELASRCRPEVLVLDRCLPDCDGLALVPQIGEVSAQTKVIVVTADLPPGMRRKLLGAGVFDVMTKPYEADDMIEAVRRALASKPAVDARLTPALGVAAPPDRHRIVNRLAGLVAGLRAFGADLRAEAGNAAAVNKAVDEYLDRLVGVALDVSEMVTRAGRGGEGPPS